MWRTRDLFGVQDECLAVCADARGMSLKMTGLMAGLRVQCH
jgi:hypothetical protein